ncbi:MAG: RidA family protein [Opitutaceae bacterium]|nr:RidA family protein [Opitutaceae bacterium]
MSAAANPGLPVPQGKYVAAKRNGQVIYTSGMTPRREGKLLHLGPVKTSESLESYRPALELATGNALAAAQALLQPGERVTEILTLTVYIAATADFTAHSRLADFASDFLHAELGASALGTRAAVGVATLPGGAPVEIQLVALAGPAPSDR